MSTNLDFTNAANGIQISSDMLAAIETTYKVTEQALSNLIGNEVVIYGLIVSSVPNGGNFDISITEGIIAQDEILYHIPATTFTNVPNTGNDVYVTLSSVDTSLTFCDTNSYRAYTVKSATLTLGTGNKQLSTYTRLSGTLANLYSQVSTNTTNIGNINTTVNNAISNLHILASGSYPDYTGFITLASGFTSSVARVLVYKDAWGKVTITGALDASNIVFNTGGDIDVFSIVASKQATLAQAAPSGMVRIAADHCLFKQTVTNRFFHLDMFLDQASNTCRIHFVVDDFRGDPPGSPNSGDPGTGSCGTPTCSTNGVINFKFSYYGNTLPL